MLRTLDQMTHLSNPHDCIAIRFPDVVYRQSPQHLCQSRIIRSCAYNTHGKDSIDSNVEVRIVRVFAQCIEDRELGARGRNETES